MDGSKSQKNKSPAATSKSKQTTPEKRRTKEPPTGVEEEKEKSELACSGADSPVFKKKGKSRKRVILDSDEEEEEEQTVERGHQKENGNHKAKECVENRVESSNDVMDAGTEDDKTRDDDGDKTSNGKSKTLYSMSVCMSLSTVLVCNEFVNPSIV